MNTRPIAMQIITVIHNEAPLYTVILSQQHLLYPAMFNADAFVFCFPGIRPSIMLVSRQAKKKKEL